MWSTKHQAPMVRQPRVGRTRRTGIFPTWAARPARISRTGPRSFGPPSFAPLPLAPPSFAPLPVGPTSGIGGVNQERGSTKRGSTKRGSAMGEHTVQYLADVDRDSRRCAQGATFGLQ